MPSNFRRVLSSLVVALLAVDFDSGEFMAIAEEPGQNPNQPAVIEKPAEASQPTESAKPVEKPSEPAKPTTRDKPATESSTTDKPATEKPPAEKPVADKPASDKPATGEKPAEEEKTPATSETAFGHSMHGQVFDEGPRQAAYLMGGTGKVHFPVTSKHPDVQKFIEQGLGQLHGFWYFEAERSFRQAAALDPDCAMAYWGMAMANTENEKRAKGFIAKAAERKKNVTPREALWIDALNTYYSVAPKANDNKGSAPAATKSPPTKNGKQVAGKQPSTGNNREKDRRRKYVRDLENIIHEYPDDLEAKAFLAVKIWQNASHELPISSHEAFDSVIGAVLAKEPMHPVHHYRIHLWDNEKPAWALKSAALCGQSAPNIAHMWHMPGHTYSNTQRYNDAVFQQEASGRVDHAFMMRDRVLPDQIHNYAHNQEWLIRNLNFVGRAHDAIELSKNLDDLPRHPKYNVAHSRGSANYGRNRLLDTLVRYEMWDELIKFSETRNLGPTDHRDDQIKRLRALGVAWISKGDLEQTNKQVAALEELLAKAKEEQEAAGTKAEKAAQDKKESEDKVAKAKKDAMEALSSKLRPINSALAELNGHIALAKEDNTAAWEHFGKADNMSKEVLSRLRFQTGDKAQAEQLAKQAVDSGKNQVYPLANYAYILYKLGKPSEAGKAMEQLRKLARQADLDAPVFVRLQPLVKELNLPDDWRDKTTPDDVGIRPDLNSLGPYTWRPVPAPSWELTGPEGKIVSLSQYRGKPVVVIFYLGYGCVHCVEQLKAFAPMTKEFADAGISLLAISTDDVPSLEKSLQKALLRPDSTGEFPFPLVSDTGLNVFKAYRVHDDFENLPLHATFLIDGEGLIRWQDISFDPFSDAKFVLNEAKRLLNP